MIGQNSDLPDEGDFNFDGKSDIVLYRHSPSRLWYIRNSISGAVSVHGYSPANGLDPLRLVAANYDNQNGGTNSDLARFHPYNCNTNDLCGLWVVSYAPVNDGRHNQAYIGPRAAGPADYFPVAGNYGGIGVQLSDWVTWQRSTGVWTIRYNSGSLPDATFQWGLHYDIPVGGDFDGDGFADRTVWRDTAPLDSGTWFIQPSTGNCPFYTTPTTGGCFKQWGLPGDIPVP